MEERRVGEYRNEGVGIVSSHCSGIGQNVSLIYVLRGI